MQVEREGRRGEGLLGVIKRTIPNTDYRLRTRKKSGDGWEIKSNRRTDVLNEIKKDKNSPIEHSNKKRPQRVKSLSKNENQKSIV